MKRAIKYTFIIILFILLVYSAVGYLSTYIGWYGYEKWKYRKHSSSIGESISRGVFVKKLNYQIDSFYGGTFKFEPFIERGFKWGHHTSGETVLFNRTNYPYQLSYNYRPNEAITISLKDDQIKKFDSAGGCLRKPHLPDTIILKIGGEGIKSGIIKVW